MKVKLLTLTVVSTLSMGAGAKSNDKAFFDYINNVICDNPQGNLIVTCNAATTTIGGSGTTLSQTSNTGTQGASELSATDQLNRSKTSDKDSETNTRIEFDQFGLFANAQYRNLDRDDTELENGYDGSGKVITAGADFSVNKSLLFGAAFSEGDSKLNFNNAAGAAKTELSEWLIFGNYQMTDAIYIDGYFGESEQENESKRAVDFGLIQYNARSDFDTEQSQWGLGVGHSTNIDQLAFDVALRYASSSADIDAYEEEGGKQLENLNLVYEKQTIDSDTLSLAFNIAANIGLESGVVVSYIRGEIIRELEDDAREITAHLALAPDEEAFVVRTDKPDSGYGIVGGGVQMIVPGGMMFFLDLETLASHDYLNTWRATTGIRMEL